LVVAALGPTLPQAPGVTVKVTGSPVTGEQLLDATVTVTDDALLPSAGRLDGLAVTVTPHVREVAIVQRKGIVPVLPAGSLAETTKLWLPYDKPL
jgi:hypothetical protein